MWNSLLDLMGSILAFFYAGISSYGIAIIGLTVVVRLVLFPLTAKQARSMQRMSIIQPEIKKLQAKYKDDRQRLNEEVMAFYKANKINPLAGCFPLIAQMPIFIALFAVLRKPHTHVPHGSTLYRAICGAKDVADCKPKGLRFLGMDLSQAASASHDGFTDALPYFILIGLVAITSYVQFKQTQARQTQANPQMAMIGKIMPGMFALISLNFPSGNVLYFLVSNLWQIGQQAIIFGTPGNPKTPNFEIKHAPPAEERPATPQRAVREPREPRPRPERKPGGLFGGLSKRELPAGDEEEEQQPNGKDRAQPKPAPKPAPKAQPRPPAGQGDNLGRAQAPGSRPKPKKRRR